MSIEWRDVVGFEGLYRISNDGQVFSISKNRNKKFCSSLRGYHKVQLSKDKKPKQFFVHRLVAFAFIPLVAGKKFINHKNGVKTDNSVPNLEWCNTSENTLHAYKHLGAKGRAKYEDIQYLAFATCLVKYKKNELKIMTPTAFNWSLRSGRNPTTIAIKEFLKEFSLIKD
jgi:hypothetical protein